MNTIAIDCGASYIKGAAFVDGKKGDSYRIATPAVAVSPFEGTKHIDEVEVIVKKMINDLLDRDGENAICISNEMHGFLLADDNDELCSDYISWQINLGDISLKSEDIKEAVFKTGMSARGSLPSSNLAWLINNRLDNEEQYHFYTLGDYLIKRIIGGKPVIHPTNAAATGLYDMTKSDWNSEIISFIGADNVIFPEISTESYEGLYGDSIIRIFPAIGDQQAALLGAGLEGNETLSFNLGTGAQISMLSEEMVLSDKWQVRPFFENKYLKTIPHIPSGRAINVFFGFIKSILNEYGIDISDQEIWDGIHKASAHGKKTALSFDLGFFENAVNNSTYGAITGIDECEFSMANFFYMMEECLAENCCRISDRLLEDKSTIKCLLFSGGVADSFINVRDRIRAYFPCVDIVMYSQGDTLEGLYKYSRM